LGENCPREDVESIFFLGYSMSGEFYIFKGENYAAEPEDFAFAVKWLEIAEKLWKEGVWKAHPQRIGSGGLLGALEGMKELKEGKVSGEKLVYLIEETNWSAAGRRGAIDCQTCMTCMTFMYSP
jgi:hypothetical protein